MGGTLNQQFLAVVNHFKSKGSGSGTDADRATARAAPTPRPRRAGQGAGGVRQGRAEARRGTEQVFLTGDFNSYTKEDPMQVLYDAGYTDIGSTFPTSRRTSSAASWAPSTTS